MSIVELRDYCQKLIDSGLDATTPVVFRGDKGELFSVDYAVMTNDNEKLLFAQEWL